MIIARPTDNKIVINNTARRSYRKSLLVCNHLVESNEKSAKESAGTRDRFILDKCKDKCYWMSEPEGSLAQSQERGSRRICFGRGKKSSSERLKRPNGVEVDGRRLQALDIMPGKAAARESPDLRERVRCSTRGGRRFLRDRKLKCAAAMFS